MVVAEGMVVVVAVAMTGAAANADVVSVTSLARG
jgi:hypothetical protein